MRIRRGLAALLALLMLWSLAPSAMMEEAEPFQPEVELADEPELSEAEEDLDVEPEVGLAEDAGDTGLIVEFEDGTIGDEYAGEESAGYELPEDEDGDAGYGDGAEDQAVEALDTDDTDENGLEIMAIPVIPTGYVAVAPEAPVYADAKCTQAMGVFPDGATVYAEAIENEGELLKIRFDTEDSRAWDQPIPAGYVLAVDALACTEDEGEELDRLLAADARTRYADGVAVPCVCFSAVDYAVLSEENTVGLNVASRTQAEIQAFLNAHPANRNQINIYRVAVSDEPFAPGKLSAVNQQSALNLLNQFRYIAGLNANVGLLTDQEDTVAAAALVLRLYSEQYKAQNGKDILTHYPGRAAALYDASYDNLYSLGYNGAGRSNIAMGYTVSSAMLAYMADSDDSNIRTVGHRRWILNPTMGRTVFGANGRFSAMYAHDLSGTGGQSKVAWPAQQMPLQYFNASDPWSVSYGRALTADGISVSLVRVRDGKTWRFSTSDADGAFYVENSAYGQRGCVIFRPDGLNKIADGDTFNVSITDGKAGEVTRYTVRFFSVSTAAGDPLALPEKVSAVKTTSGNELSWSAVSGAKSYYVCRRASSEGYYHIVADVSATSWKDTKVSMDKTYYYQIYGHDASRTSRSAVTVEAKPLAPNSVKLSASGTVKLYRNKTLQLSVSYSPAKALSENLTWKSSKKKVATVTSTGQVKPKKAGTTVISVTTDNGKSASVKVKVVNVPKPKKVKLNKSGTVKLNKGETLQLTGTVTPAAANQKLTWKSSKKKVATVTSTGLITAVEAGKATITAKASNGKKATIKVKVIDPYAPTAVILYKSGSDVKLKNGGTVKLHKNETLQLKGKVLPAIASQKLTWKSSKKKVAYVDENGLVTAKKKGTATITVKAVNGKKVKLKIKVVK